MAASADDHQVTGYECAFCEDGMDVDAPDLVVLTASRPGAVEWQELYAHRGCFASLVRPGVPLGEVFGDAEGDGRGGTGSERMVSSSWPVVLAWCLLARSTGDAREGRPC